MALLESCTSISKTFGSRALFENISLGISEGERLGLIGPNGAGKSTLLRILSGQLEPDSGSISMRRNTRIGYVPQQAAFPAGRTAAEIVAEAIAEERLDDLERAARINITLGRAGFTDGAVAHRIALRRLDCGAWPSPASWRSSPTCCSWTNPPTISIWKASCGSKSCSPPPPSPAWW